MIDPKVRFKGINSGRDRVLAYVYRGEIITAGLSEGVVVTPTYQDILKSFKESTAKITPRRIEARKTEIFLNLFKQLPIEKKFSLYQSLPQVCSIRFYENLAMGCGAIVLCSQLKRNLCIEGLCGLSQYYSVNMSTAKALLVIDLERGSALRVKS